MLIEQPRRHGTAPIGGSPLRKRDELLLLGLVQGRRHTHEPLAVFDTPDQRGPAAILLNTVLTHEGGHRVQIVAALYPDRYQPLRCGNTKIEVRYDGSMFQLLRKDRQRCLIGGPDARAGSSGGSGGP